MANDSSFILGLICYHWSSFHNYGSYSHKVFTLFLFFLWVMSTCASFFLYLFMDGFLSLIFIYRIFLLFRYESAKMISNSPRMEWDTIVNANFILFKGGTDESALQNNYSSSPHNKCTKIINPPININSHY